MTLSQKTPLMSFHHLPKVELHLHLDCSLSSSVVSKLNPLVTHKEYLETFIAPAKCTNLAECLTRALKGIELMQTEEQLRLVTQDLFAQLVQDNVFYAEIRFAPHLHTEQGLSAHEIVRVVEATVSESIKATGVEARLILCTLRHFSQTQSLDTLKLVEQFKGTYVAGFDIAGDEVGFPIDAHISAFQYAAAHNIPCTAHAGEARGSNSIWETLQHFHPLRLGHGVRSIEDPSLLEHLRQHNIHLEICPTCNVQTDVCLTYSDHPISDIYDAGLSISVNTDTRAMTNITLTQEYEKLHRTFGWGKEQFLQCNLHALRAAFISEPVKQRLINRLLEAYHTL
jgi:adenosine deaminase